MRLVILGLLVSMSAAHAQSSYEDSEQFIGEGEWRQQAPNHYNSGECCFCLPAENARATDVPGVTEYLVNERWYPMADTYIKPALPGKPPTWVTICDVEQMRYPCVIYGAGT